MNSATNRKTRRLGRYRYRYRRFHSLHLDMAMVLSLLSGWLLLPSFSNADYDTAAEPLGIYVENIMREAGSPDALVFSPDVFAFGGGESALLPDAGNHTSASSEALMVPPTPPVEFSPAAIAASTAPAWPGASVVGTIKMPASPNLKHIAHPVEPVSFSTHTNAARRIYISASGGLIPATVFAAEGIGASHGISVEVFVSFDSDGNAMGAVLGPNSLAPENAAALERSAMRLKGAPDTSAYIILSVPES